MKAESISFFSVNLVCGAAPDIGCGSRSKPVLLELEKQPEIAEAWLNRQGTVIATVWAKDAQPDADLVAGIIEKHGLSPEGLYGKEHRKQLRSFKKDTWYKGERVNELSMEEAGRIAHQVVDPLMEQGLLSNSDGKLMHSDVEKYIQQEFLELKDVSLLSQSSYYDQWEEKIGEIAARYIPKDKVPKFELCGTAEKSCKPEENCGKGKGGSSCCKPAQSNK